MNSNTKNNGAFDVAYNSIDTVIPFDPKWNNGTGYFDRATAVAIKSGEYAKSYCKESNRKLILIGTALGTLVLFQRYANGASDIVVYNSPSSALTYIDLTCLPAGRLGSDQIADILGMPPMYAQKDRVEFIDCFSLPARLERLFGAYQSKSAAA